MKTYIGYFNCRSTEEDHRENTFSAVVRAPEPEQALENLKALIGKAHKANDTLDSGASIYLDDLIEMTDDLIPEEGSMLQYTSLNRESGFSIARALSFPEENPLNAYSIVDPEVEEPVTVEPFVVLPDSR